MMDEMKSEIIILYSMCETIFKLDFGFNVPNSACESIIGLCCLEFIVKFNI